MNYVKIFIFLVSFFLIPGQVVFAQAKTPTETPTPTPTPTPTLPTTESKPDTSDESPIGGTGIKSSSPSPSSGTTSTDAVAATPPPVVPPPPATSPQTSSSQKSSSPSSTPETGKPQTGDEKKKAESWSAERDLVPPSEGGSLPALDTKISLDLRDMDILEVLKFFAIKGNLNIVGGKNITGTVNLLLNNVSVGDALKIVLSTNRLAYSMKGNVMQVMTEEEYKAIYGKQFYDERETKIVRLRYASAKNVGAMLENVKSDVGRIVYDNSTGTIVMMDSPGKIKEMEELIQHEELPSVVRMPTTQTEVFELQYAKAKGMSEKITPMLSKDDGKVYVDERTNKLIVSDLPFKIEEIRKAVKAFDSKTQEVFIEAKIIQIVLNDKYQSGVDWSRAIEGHLQGTFPISLSSYGQVFAGTIEGTATADSKGVTSTTYSKAGAILKFLETFGDTKIVSSPHISAINDQEAKIMVGTREAYTTSSITQSQATTTTAQNVAFIDVGVTLNVTPHINDDNFITMKIKPEISTVTRFLTTSQGDQIPIVQTTNADTTVMVKDGNTALIGGLMQLTRTKSRSGVPGLSQIPIAGNLFRSTNDNSAKSELVVLLTPHLVNGEEALPGTAPVPSVAGVGGSAGGIEESNITGPEKNIETKKKKKPKRRRWDE